MANPHDYREPDWETRYQAWKAKKDADKQKQQQKQPETKPYYQTTFEEIKKDVHTAEKEIKSDIKKAEVFIENEYETHPFITKSLIAIAFLIPLAILLYALYVNFLPFGYENSFQLTIANGTISPISNEIYLTNIQGRKLLSLPEETNINGQVNLIINPKVIIKNATLNISIEGTGISLGTPIAFNPDSYNWDYNWDFTSGIPNTLNGTAQYDNSSGCVKFDAVKEQTLYLPNSSNMFESTPMSIYVKWKPSELSKDLGNYQQIIGHFNWELYQNAELIRFQIGRANDINGTFYILSYPITNDFFNKTHEALAVYAPGNNSGYIELFIDNNFAGRTLILNDTIYKDYGGISLSFGWSPHNYNKNPYFDGCLYNAKISNNAIVIQGKTQDTITTTTNKIAIPIIGQGNITSIKTFIKQE